MTAFRFGVVRIDWLKPVLPHQEDIRTLIAANASELDVELIRREWATVTDGEEQRTAWLEAALAVIGE